MNLIVSMLVLLASFSLNGRKAVVVHYCLFGFGSSFAQLSHWFLHNGCFRLLGAAK